MVGTAVLSGCSSPDVFETAELITVTETLTRSEPTSNVVKPVATMLGDGVYKVGEEVAAGWYVTTGAPVPGTACRWYLLPYEDAPLEQALSGGFTDGPGHLTVSVGDIIKTRGGCDWQLA